MHDDAFRLILIVGFITVLPVGIYHRLKAATFEKLDRRLVEGHITHELPSASVFGSLTKASDFFEKGSLGYSVTAKPDQFDGLELRSFNWQILPLSGGKVKSSFFETRALFPAGSVEFDCALLMRGIEHEWHGRGQLCAA